MVAASVKGIGRVRTGNIKPIIDTLHGNAYTSSNFACLSTLVNSKRGRQTSWKRNHRKNRYSPK
jgi:hypothetical protein